MSELAIAQDLRKRSWALPGGVHDRLVGSLKVVLPAAIGVLMAFLAMAPLSRSQEISFILDKSKVEVAKERMRVQAAQYRGRDAKGRPFSILADSAVQATSQDPIVDITGMSARLLMDDGPASLRALRGQYDLEKEQMAVVGPILFSAPDGYSLATRDVTVDLAQRSLASRGRVDGRIPLGTFSADSMTAALSERRVTLVGRARMRIVQGAGQ
jgi:lipopolysaccharide export system protein LptC